LATNLTNPSFFFKKIKKKKTPEVADALNEEMERIRQKKTLPPLRIGSDVQAPSGEKQKDPQAWKSVIHEAQVHLEHINLK
jgi:hypothetical protein